MNPQDDILATIFSRALSGPSIFRDRDVLRSEYVPRRLPFREKQTASMGEILSPVLRGAKPSNLLLYGKTGTGKTAVAKYVLTKLSEASQERKVKFSSAYSNTRMAGTEYRVLYDFSNTLGLDVPFTGLALREVSERILSHIDSTTTNTIFILDEVDHLVKNFGDDLLYELTRANERLSEGSISLVGISNDLGFKDLLDPRVISTLGEEELVFPPYTAEELKTILQERASLAFTDGVVEDATVNLCAALAASEHGDARRAVDLLRVAGEITERENSTQMEEKHVRLALQKIDQDRMSEALSSLPLHQKLILLAVVSADSANCTTGEVYFRYSSICRSIGVETLTQRRVSGLLNELDMLGLVSANTISHGRYGRTKKVSALINIELVKGAWNEDPFLKSLI